MATALETCSSYFEQVLLLPKDSNSSRKDAFRALASEEAVALAIDLVYASGVRDLVLAWREADRVADGRPGTVPAEAALIAPFALAQTGLPTTIHEMHRLITKHKMSRATRTAFGFPTSDDPAEDARLDRERGRLSYFAVAREYAAVCATIDPKPYPGGRRRSREQIEEIDANRDQERVRAVQERADEFVSRILLHPYLSLPDEIRNLWDGTITADGTFISVPGKRGNANAKQGPKGSQSPEVNAGFYTKVYSETNDGSVARATRGEGADAQAVARRPARHGYEGHIALMAGLGVGVDFPALAIGLRMDTPAVATGLNLVEVLKRIVRAGAPTGLLIVDRGYSQLTAERFAFHVRMLGYQLVIDYKINELGLQEQYGGVLLVDGNLYGCCLPERLQDAAITFRDAAEAAQRLSSPEARKATLARIRQDLDRQIAERQRYVVRIKSSKTDKSGFASITARCPAQQTGATVTCRLRPNEPRTSKNDFEVLNVPEHPPLLCTNASSLTLPGDFGLRTLQPLPYLTQAWRYAYAVGRNAIESRNRKLKNGARSALDIADHRRFQGMGKQLVAIVAKVAADNADVMADWIDKSEGAVGTDWPAPEADESEQRSIAVEYANRPALWIPGRKQPQNPENPGRRAA